MKKPSSSKIFQELVKETSYKDKDYTKLISLTNMTFFLGAGFSKSWDLKYPNGQELFSLDREDMSDDFTDFLLSIGYSDLKSIGFNEFKEIAYQISMQKKYPSLRRRYIDEYNLQIIENEISSIITKRFNKLIPLNYIENASKKLELEKSPNQNQKNIVSFFSWLESHTTGDTDQIPEGLRINFITTNYDFLIESILDETLGSDDTHLIYAYRGFTPKSTNKAKTPTTIHRHWLVQNLIKLNGGFEIFGSDEKGFNVDYTNKTARELNRNAPILILPNREQDYTGKYFQTIFPKAVRTLQETKILVIVGYSIPDEDALIRLLLRQFAEENVDGTEKVIFFIDLMNEEEQIRKLESVFPYHKMARRRYNIIPFKGTFNDWINEIMALNSNV
ncbi:MAG: SIR2 family protein [Zunongwangia sp.]|uniref:SIR2 family protein n=1 Tax=Zunongwangia sp. TaxID=1965325 RepID=UPI003241C2FB